MVLDLGFRASCFGGLDQSFLLSAGGPEGDARLLGLGFAICTWVQGLGFRIYGAPTGTSVVEQVFSGYVKLNVRGPADQGCWFCLMIISGLRLLPFETAA